MATVVVTFFLISQFNVCNMDDEYIREQSEYSKREKRWSMTSQRLEEIVAQLMKPISEVSEDTNLSSLLEEYLTEAGLKVLHAAENDGDTAAAGHTENHVPNFGAVALLLQQSAYIYSRKVDVLYQHVLDVSESIRMSEADEAPAKTSEPPTPLRTKQKRKPPPVTEEFLPIELTPSPLCQREHNLHPPPALPRSYVDLGSNDISANILELYSYEGESVGMLSQFNCFFRLQDGRLLEELATSQECSTMPRPELPSIAPPLWFTSPPITCLCTGSCICPSTSTALSPCTRPPTSPTCAGTPVPSLPLCGDSSLVTSLDTPPADVSSLCELPPACSSPLPSDTRPPSRLSCSTPLPMLPAVPRKARKRKVEDILTDICSLPAKLKLNEAGSQRLKTISEFTLPPSWKRRILQRRNKTLRGNRLQEQPPLHPSNNGFLGWSDAEVALAQATDCPKPGMICVRGDDSVDDGFFEQSSPCGSDGSRVEDSMQISKSPPPSNMLLNTSDDVAFNEWAERVERDAAAAERRGGDIQQAAGVVLQSLQSMGDAPETSCGQPFTRVLENIVKEPQDVAKYFMATLFLANSENVEIVQGPPLTLTTFSLKLLSTDERQYSVMARAEELFSTHTACPRKTKPR